MAKNAVAWWLTHEHMHATAAGVHGDASEGAPPPPGSAVEARARRIVQQAPRAEAAWQLSCDEWRWRTAGPRAPLPTPLAAVAVPHAEPTPLEVEQPADWIVLSEHANGDANGTRFGPQQRQRRSGSRRRDASRRGQGGGSRQ